MSVCVWTLLSDVSMNGFINRRATTRGAFYQFRATCIDKQVGVRYSTSLQLGILRQLSSKTRGCFAFLANQVEKMRHPRPDEGYLFDCLRETRFIPNNPKVSRNSTTLEVRYPAPVSQPSKPAQMREKRSLDDVSEESSTRQYDSPRLCVHNSEKHNSFEGCRFNLLWFVGKAQYLIAEEDEL